MILFVLLAIICFPLVYVLLDYLLHVLSLKKYPPGPFPLPVLGNLHLLGPHLHEDFYSLTKKYGDVYGFSFGMNRLIVVNAIEPTREALISKGAFFAGRGTSSAKSSLLSRGFTDLLFADYGTHWKIHRKLFHTALKSYGEDTGCIDEKLKMEADKLNDRLRKSNSQPVDCFIEFSCSILNIICAISFGQRYNVEDEELKQIITFNKDIMDSLGLGDPAAYIPWLKYFPMKDLTILKKGVAMRDKLVSKKVNERKKTYNPEVVRDFVDSLIKTSGDETLFEGMGSDRANRNDNLDLILGDMLLAGGETTVTGLRWLMVYFLHWPQIQEDCYNEIIAAVGDKRYPELEDQPKLSFCLATIQEMLRYSSFATLGIPHKSSKDSSIAGLNVPKNTEVFFNLWGINHDAREYTDPDTFNPQRWLDENGAYDPKRHRSFVPFSLGRRGCLGENLARKEMFFIVTRLVRDFRVEANKDEKFPSLRGIPGGTLAPHTFTVIFTPRN